MSEAKKLENSSPEEPEMSNEEENARPSLNGSRDILSKFRRFIPFSRANRDDKDGGPPDIKPARKKTWTRRLFHGGFFVFKWSMLIGTAFVILLAVGYKAARLHFNDDKIKALIESIAQEQTGGSLDIGSLKFSLFRGLQISNLVFYPVASRPIVGPPQNHETPLLKVEQIQVKYSLPKILLGRLHIASLKLVRPELSVYQVGEAFNFTQILNFRKEHFPTAPEAEKPQAEVPESSSQDLKSIKALLFYMPIEIMLHDIGVDRFKLNFQKFDKNLLVQNVKLEGASVDLGAHWYKTSSHFWLTLASSFEKPLRLKYEVNESQNKPELKSLIELESVHVINISLQDFSRINLDIATRLPRLAFDKMQQNDATLYLKGRLRASDDYNRLIVETFETKLLDIFSYILKGEVAKIDGSTDKLGLQIEQSFNLDLTKASTLVASLAPGVKTQGNVRLESLSIQGELDLKKLDDMSKAEGLPAVSGVLWLDQIKGSMDNSGIDMSPLSGRISILSTPKPNMQGIQADISVDLNLSKFSITQNEPRLGSVQAGTKDLSVKLLSRFVWPDATVPIFKLDVESPHVTASGTNIAPIDVPLYLNVNGEGDKALTNLSLSQDFQLGDLAEVSFVGDCQNSCSRFRTNFMARLESLKRLHNIVLPTKGLLIPTEYMPNSLDGIVDIQFNSRGQIPNPLKSPPAEILKSGEVRFNLQASVAKLSANVPFKKLNLKSLDNRIIANGDLKEQNFELTQKFALLSLESPLPQANAKASEAGPKAFKVEQHSFDLQITNGFAGTINLAKPLENMTTQLQTWLNIGKIDLPGLLPKPLSDLSFDTNISQSHLNSIKVENISLKSPDYGTSLKLVANAQLDADMLPVNFHTSLQNQFNHSGSENLPGGIKTVGRLDSRIDLSSDDMRHLTLDGIIGFDRFSLFLTDKDNPAIKRVSVEDITGQIPIKQVVKIPYIKDILNSSSAPMVAKTPTKEASDPTENGAAAAINIADIKPNSDSSSPSDLASSMELYDEKTRDKLAKTTNTVAIVDYGSIRPFFPDKKPISIHRIDIANLELSNLEFDVELKQNWFALNQYIVSFLGGKIQGGFLLAFDAAFPDIKTLAADAKRIPKSLKASVHLTRLDTRKLIERFPNLKGKGESLIPVFSNPYLDGTVHLTYDFLTAEMGGGIEITSIGKEQLKMMLYYVDPFEQNATISDIRSALELGEVRQVSIPLKNGEIGLSVDVRILGAPIPTPKLTRFPLSQIIKNFVDQSSEAPAETPKAEGPTGPSAAIKTRRNQYLWVNSKH